MSRGLGFLIQTAWASGSQLGQAAVGMVSVLAMSRILGPEIYGVFAIAMIFIGLAETLVGGHVVDIIVQRRAFRQSLASAAFLTVMGLGLLCAVVLWIIAPLVADAYDDPRLTNALRVLASVPILGAISSVPTELLVRRMRFDQLAQAGFASAVVGLIAGVIVAVQGGGVYGLVTLEVTRRVVLGVGVFLATNWRPSYNARRADFVELAPYAARRVQIRAVQFVGAEAMPRAVISWVLGTEALGIYTVSWRLLQQISAMLSGPVAGVVFPTAAAAQGEPQVLQRLMSGSITLATWTSWPAVLGLIVVAPVLVPVALSDRWSMASVAVQLLAVAMLRQSVGGWIAPMLLGMGRVHAVAHIQSIALVLSALALAIGTQFGLAGVALALGLVPWALWPFETWFLSRAVKVRNRTQLATLARAARPAAAMFVVLMAARGPIIHWMPEVAALTLLIVAGVVLYVGFWFAFYRELSRELLTILRQVLSGERAVARSRLIELVRRTV